MVSGGRSRKRCHPRNSAAALASVAGCGAHRLQRLPASRDSPAKQKLWISTAMQKKKPPGEPGGKFNREALQGTRSEEHTSELQSLMRISYAVFCLKKKKNTKNKNKHD